MVCFFVKPAMFDEFHVRRNHSENGFFRAFIAGMPCSVGMVMYA
jgi:hypothetical protein